MRYKDLINENKPGSIAHQINWGSKNKEPATQQPKKGKGLIRKAISSVKNIFSDTQYNEMTAGAVASVAQPMSKKRKKTNEVAGPDKCWPGYAPGAKTGVKTKAGTGKNKGKRVNNCEKK